MADDRPEDPRAADRLIAFSDAVVAIAMTLLALELPVPSGDTAAELWASARHNQGHYLAFLISFVVIAAAWQQHHRVFDRLRRVDSRLRSLNMLWLLMIVLNPFATKLLTTEGHDSLTANALRWSFYALLQTLAATLMLAMVFHMDEQSLQGPDASPTLVPDTRQQCFGVMIGFGASIPVFFATKYGWLLWIATPWLIKGTRALRESRDARGGAE
ncbi:TMEM175 family protein [Streptacidiphilus sp. N8-3]|uniref:TMEM175 family protein n=1 Tax=Streptacidiphilus cavernicola TaxID=3342716 RepID=A0ABV6VZ18_9ACTN